MGLLPLHLPLCLSRRFSFLFFANSLVSWEGVDLCSGFDAILGVAPPLEKKKAKRETKRRKNSRFKIKKRKERKQKKTKEDKRKKRVFLKERNEEERSKERKLKE